MQLLIELRKLHVRGVDLRIGLRVDLRVLQHGGAPRLRFLEQLGAFGLCIGCGSGLLRLLRAVFLQLFDQDLHLGLEHGIFFVKGDIILCQRLEKIIDLLHVIAAEDGLGKGLFLNFLRCEHRRFPPWAFGITDRVRCFPARR